MTKLLLIVRNITTLNTPNNMFWSKNNTFRKTPEELDSIFSDMILLLNLKGRNDLDVVYYVRAFNFFRSNPYKFDGATIVKDLNDLPNLDLDAMVHDWHYISGANKNFIKKFNADYRYIKNMEKNGKGIRVFRFFLLTISGILFVPYCFCFND